MAYIPNQRIDGEPTCDRDFLFNVLNTLEPDYFPAQLRAIEEEKKLRMVSKTEDVIEVKPEIMDLLNAFDCRIKSKGDSRVLSLLKAGAKKRKNPRSSEMLIFSQKCAQTGSQPKRMKMAS